MLRRKNRKHSKIDKLPPVLKEMVEQMLLTTATYAEIIDYLRDNGESISQASLSRYAQNYHANMQMLAVAQENFSRMQEAMERHPDLDVTEAITRLSAQRVFDALANVDEDAWREISPEQILRQSTALVRAAAYKQRIDVQNATTQDAAIDEVKALVFEAMKKERPELYSDVVRFLNEKKAAAQ